MQFSTSSKESNCSRFNSTCKQWSMAVLKRKQSKLYQLNGHIIANYLLTDIYKRLLELVGCAQAAFIELNNGLIEQYFGIIGPRYFDSLQMF